VNLPYSKEKYDLFVGREKELLLLDGYFDPILENQGSFVLIEGETGIGKTRLVEKFLEKTESKGTTIIRSHGYHGEISPYRLFSEMLRHYFSSIHYDTRYLAPLLDNLTIALLEKIIPELKQYLPFDVSSITTPPLSPKEEKQRFFDTLLLFFTKLSQRYPLILNIEDLHWLEPDTLELLRYLITNFRKSPILVIATSRGAEAESFMERWLTGLEDQRLVRRLKLSGLGAVEVKSLAKDFFNADLSGNFFDWLLEYTAGNPLFVNETLRSGMEQNVFYYDPVESRWEVKEEYSEIIQEPATIQSVIDRRLSGLDQHALKLLSYAAIIGDRFDLNTQQKLLVIPLLDLKQAVGNLIVGNLIQKISDNEEEKRTYRFTHHVVRLHIYQGLSVEFRQKVHQKIAALMEKGQGKQKLSSKLENLAYHYSRGRKDPTSIKKSINYLILAGQKMQKQYSEGKAEQYFLQALELIKSRPDSKEKHTQLLKLLECLGEVQSRLGKPDTAIHYYQEVLELAKTKKLSDPLREAQTHRKIGYVYHTIADYSTAISYYERALKILKDASSKPKRAEHIAICNSLGLTYVMKGEHQQCAYWSNQGIQLAGKEKHSPLVEQGYNNLGMIAYSQGKYEEAIGHFNRCLDIQNKIQDQSRLSALNINLGVIHLHLGQYDQAEDFYRKGLNLASEMGNLAWKAIIYNNLGVMYKDKGDWEKAIGYLEKSLKIREQYGDRRGMLSTYDNLGVTFLSQGQPDKALDYVNQSFELCRQIGAKDLLPVIQTDLGEVYFQLNQPEKAFNLVQEALDLAVKKSSKLTVGIAKRTMGRFHLSIKEYEKAVSLLQESKVIFEELGSRFHLAQTLESLGLCLAHMAQTEESKEKETSLQKGMDTLDQAVKILSELGFEKRLSALAKKIKQNHLEVELKPILNEIEERTTGLKVKMDADEGEKIKTPIGISGDYIGYLRIYCFGRFRVYRPFELEEVSAKEWGSVKAKQILAYLAVKDTRKIGVTRDKLVDAIWPEIDPQSLGNTFHVTLSHLRKAIERSHKEAKEKEREEYVISQTGVYRINRETKIWSDVGEFLTCLDRAVRFQKEEKLHLMDMEYQKAAELYSSNLLEDFYESWAEQTRDEYREKYNIVFGRLAQSAWEKSDYEKCIRYLQSLLLSDPTNEEAHRMIMLSYALLGSRSAAIRQFKVCENNLKKYLEIEPEPETVNLHKKIKHGNPKDYRKLLNLVG
jgi:predicted ATPase/DNA-binding SARP family transcriptional activator